MLTVDKYARIRRADRDGMSIGEIARRFHHSRRKVREALARPEPKPYTRTKEPTAPKLGRLKALIDEILAADEEAPRKQRHWATQIFRRLVKEGYEGGYDQVRRCVSKRRRREQETFIPLDHDPGQRVEADFGHIWVDFPDHPEDGARRRQVPVLLLTWAFSCCPFAIALPTERTEAILHGMVEGFEFFGCVPKEVWWDNPTTVAVTILTGRQRVATGQTEPIGVRFEQVEEAIERTRQAEGPLVDLILERTEQLGRRQAESAFRLDSPEILPAAPHIEVPLPDLRRFNLLLSQGDEPYECQSHALVEEQPQAVATADDVCRV